MKWWRRSKIQISFLGISLIVVLILLYQRTPYSLNINNKSKLKENPNCPNKKPGDERSAVLEPFLGEKLVHLDLKGAPPLVSFLQEFFPHIRKFGATGILMEYEDMFFYRDELENLRAKNAYQPAALKKMLSLAEENNLMVIPLVQTFGHFEFVLKLKEYKDLREEKEYPEALCPTHEKALPLVKKMLGQVLEAHPKATYIHIGCGEVYYLGRCDKCKNEMKENKLTSANLYLNYIREIVLYLNATYPGVRPIIWGDMISKFRKSVLINSSISTMVDVMIWKYSPHVPQYITEKLLSLYASVFNGLWIASAFKGATGVNQRVTDISCHLKNHISWMGIVDKWKTHINFKGIALTGRQRYSHFSELCELLPVGIPSLTVNLIYLNGTDISKDSKNVKIFKCDHLLSFSPNSYYSFELPECNFPGVLVYRLINKYEILLHKINGYFKIPGSGFFSLYNILNKFDSPSEVKHIFEKRHIEEDLDDLILFEEELKNALSEIYDQYTVQEWLLTYVTPTRLKLQALSYAKELLQEQETWPRRPLVSGNKYFDAAKKICSYENKVTCALFLI